MATGRDTFLKDDLPAGLVVFLVALPLCLGVALASNAPLLSGIISGVVGGCVIAALSDSQVSVSGPAAGLAVIVAASIQSLGSYQAFLAAAVLAGFAQIALGLLRAGAIGDYVPNSVIKGMLAGIGLNIILKQIPHALGHDLDWMGDLGFSEQGGQNTFSSIASAVRAMAGGPVVISACSLVVLIAWDKLAAAGPRLFKLIPGPLAVVVLGIVMNLAFRSFAVGLYISDVAHLVSLPSGSFRELLGELSFPDFSVLSSSHAWTVAFTIAAVASVETLLSLEAADRIDPQRRISSPNRELWVQGVGNVVSGMLGGLPVTSVVLRTSANVAAGGRTWKASVVHGLLLLGAVSLLARVLNLVPLASLAAVLIMVGYKLTTISLYRSTYRLGLDQFIPLVVTVLAILVTDLLEGVIIGLACGLFFVIRSNHHRAATVVSKESAYLVRFNKDVTFVNKNELRHKLRAIADGSDVLIDATKASYIDRDIAELVADFKTLAVHKGITVELKQFEGKTPGPEDR
jgi:MFS superfamily sulfate permease-like transporter